MTARQGAIVQNRNENQAGKYSIQASGAGRVDHRQAGNQAWKGWHVAEPNLALNQSNQLQVRLYRRRGAGGALRSGTALVAGRQLGQMKGYLVPVLSSHHSHSVHTL